MVKRRDRVLSMAVGIHSYIHRLSEVGQMAVLETQDVPCEKKICHSATV